MSSLTHRSYEMRTIRIRIALLRLELLDGLGSLRERPPCADGVEEVDAAELGEAHQFNHVTRLRAVMSENLLAREREGEIVLDGQRAPAFPPESIADAPFEGLARFADAVSGKPGQALRGSSSCGRRDAGTRQGSRDPPDPETSAGARSPMCGWSDVRR